LTTNKPRAALLARPLVLALVVTLANAAKPVLIDDTAYLTYARHVAAHPLDAATASRTWSARRIRRNTTVQGIFSM
jgi:hypothetical protein